MRMARALVSSCVMIAGCQHFERAHECRALADSVNPELRELSMVYADYSPLSAEEFHSAGRKYAAAAARIPSGEFKEPELS